MMKGKYLLPLLLLVLSCHQTGKRGGNAHDGANAVQTQHVHDSLMLLVSDSLEKARIRSAEKDKTCPVLITNYSLKFNKQREPQAIIGYKNMSKKGVNGVKIDVHCYNNFDEPVNRSAYGTNEYVGLDQDLLPPGKSVGHQWTMHLFKNTTKIIPTVYRVHFTDGTHWPADKPE